MKYIENQYCYTTTEGTHYGFFNIYQARSGAIFLCMGHAYTALTLNQIGELPIQPYLLKDYDHEAFTNYYKS